MRTGTSGRHASSGRFGGFGALGALGALVLSGALVAGVVVAETGTSSAFTLPTFTVTTTADTHDAHLGDGVCADATSACSLRAAIEEADTGSVPFVQVVVPAGTYTLALGDLILDRNGVSVKGADARTTIISGGDKSRVFRAIGDGTGTTLSVTLTQLTLTHGNGTPGSSSVTTEARPGFGGAILVTSGVQVASDHLRIITNSATSAGGAVAAVGASPSPITNGELQAQFGTFKSEVSGNSVLATGSGPVNAGGGVYCIICSASITDSTVAGNSVSSSVAGLGSALYVSAGLGFMDSTTMANNSNAASVSLRTSSSLTLNKNILSSPTNDVCDKDISSAIGDGDHNLGPSTQCNLTQPNDVLGVDPQLGPLQDNGGQTDTMMPAAGSPALGKGGVPDYTTDQRDAARSLTASDIGSVERAASVSPSPTSTSPSPSPTDTTPPTVVPSGPVAGYALGSKVGFSYGATDTSGIASYDVRYRSAAYTGGFGAYAYPSTWQHTTARSVSVTAAVGRDYCFSVRARDLAGNVSAWSSERCQAVPLDDRNLKASSGWSKVSNRVLYRATGLSTKKKGVTLTVSGAVVKRIAIVAETCATCGSVVVLVNGHAWKTVSLVSKRTTYRVVKVLPLLALKKYTITLKVATSSKTVLIDGLSLSRT